MRDKKLYATILNIAAGLWCAQVAENRAMNVHEYQAKELFAKYRIPVARGYLARSAVEAEFAFKRLGSSVAVVKAQVHAGGRGKGGGVKLVKSAEESGSVASKMLGMMLVTKQTGAGGKKVRKVYVEAGSAIAKEYYLAMLVDRETATIACMFSTEGGMDIEEVAARSPEKIHAVHIDPTVGLQGFHLRRMIWGAGLTGVVAKNFSNVVRNLYKLFTEYDCSLLEINPLIVTQDQDVVALDAKMDFDSNALFRHPEIEAMRDFDEEDAREVEASKHDLNYIGLSGNIGCLVNGAGLAMATMDIIKHYGGEPANFLDVGGGATQEMVTHAFRLLLGDSQVKAIFVNIFGGIMRCDVIAEGIVGAAKELGMKVPLVVRLEGTNVDQGRKILSASGLKITSAQDMADGAQKVVAAAR